MPVGTHLTAQELAERFSVSRFPVGQALQLLATKGVLTHERNRGYFVSDVKGVSPEMPRPYRQGRCLRRLFQDRRRSSSWPPARSGLRSLSQGSLRADEGAAERGSGPDRPGGLGRAPARLRLVLLADAHDARKAWSRPIACAWPLNRRLCWSRPTISTPTSPRAAARPSCGFSGGAIETDSADALHERGVRFHEAIVGASGNPFFLEAVRRINRVRRLLSYRSMVDRKRYRQQCEEHLQILDLLERERNAEASQALRRHLEHTIGNLQEIRPILEH